MEDPFLEEEAEAERIINEFLNDESNNYKDGHSGILLEVHDTTETDLAIKN